MSIIKENFKWKKFLSCMMAVLLIILSWDSGLRVKAAESRALSEGRTFFVDILMYKVIDEENRCVEVVGYNRNDTSQDGAHTGLFGALNIPATVTYYDVTYYVTKIGKRAIEGLSATSIVIPEGVKEIGEQAFYACESAETVSLPTSLETIGKNAFAFCGNGTTNGVTVTMKEGVKEIGDSAFYGSGIKEITIPSSVKTLGTAAFARCVDLEKVTIMEGGITRIPRYAFDGCKSLTKMEIAIDETKPIIPISIYDNSEDSVFGEVPVERKLFFLNADGTRELTGSSLAAAQTAYKNADNEDMTVNDWFGWKIGNIEDFYTVNIDVKKDGEQWDNHEKQFRLKDEKGDMIYYLLVENGTYTVCVVAGETVVDTGVTVKVEDSNASVMLEYYTVTFNDNDTAYENNTMWGQQIVRKGDNVVKPNSNPEKDALKFAGWKTNKEGSEDFDFLGGITGTTNIYASWSEDSGDSTEPSRPTDTENPTSPSKPTDTENPPVPSNPTDTENPSSPSNLADTETTITPNKPSDTETPSTPSPSPSSNGSPELEEPEASAPISGAEKGERPKTGDTNHVQIYATAAMIAGLSYVMLIFAKRKEGMTEEEKNIRVSALIEWSKKGSRVRKYAALTAIFFLLFYYHSIGKRLDLEWEEICGN